MSSLAEEFPFLVQAAAFSGRRSDPVGPLLMSDNWEDVVAHLAALALQFGGQHCILELMPGLAKFAKEKINVPLSIRSQNVLAARHITTWGQLGERTPT